MIGNIDIIVIYYRKPHRCNVIVLHYFFFDDLTGVVELSERYKFKISWCTSFVFKYMAFPKAPISGRIVSGVLGSFDTGEDSSSIDILPGQI